MSAVIRSAVRSLAVVSLTLGAVILIASGQADAAPGDVGLGTAASFGVLAGQGVTNTGPTVIGADLGTCPNPAITGFPPGIVLGTVHAADAVACQAQSDLVVAYNDAAGRAPTTTFGGPTDLGGMTLVAGVYNSPSSLAITGSLVLDGQGNPDSVFIFQAASTLITATNSSVDFINGAQACNVFWQIGSSVTLGVGSTMKGTVMALSAIAANTNAAVEGRLLARNASITLDSNVIQPATCAAATPTTTGATATTTPTTLAPGATTTSTTLAPGATTTSTTLAPGATTTSTTSAETLVTTATTSGSGSAAAGSALGPTPNAPAASGRAVTVTDRTPTGRSAAPRLPRTGSAPGPEALLGIAFIAFGTLLLAATRKRAQKI